MRSERPIDHALPLESLDGRRDRADPKPGRDERDRRMEVRRTVDDTRGEPGFPAEREDLIVEGPYIFGRDQDERLRLKIRYVDTGPTRERVMARQSDDDRVAPECLIDETRIGGLRPDEPDIDLSVEQCLPLRDRPQILQPDVDVREVRPPSASASPLAATCCKTPRRRCRMPRLPQRLDAAATSSNRSALTAVQ